MTLTSRCRIPIALGLLALPTLIFAWVAVGLIRQNANHLFERLVSADRALVEGKVANRLAGCVESAKRRIESVLASLPVRPTTEDLISCASREPSVRNVFRWIPSVGVVYPREKGATQEERRFLSRYVTLFDEGFRTPDSATSQMRFSKRKVSSETGRFTWKSWFEGDRLSYIGWRKNDDGSVLGAELEIVAVEAEFPAILSAEPFDGLVMCLRTDDGRALFQTAAIPSGRAAFTLSLAPALPHRELAVWRTRPDGASYDDIWRLIAVSALLFTSLGLGVGLLFVAAARERRESLRKTSFVSNVSHELKTPLTSIRLSAEMLFERRVTTPEAQARYLDVIVRECARLSRLVENVLDFSRLEQNRRKYVLEDCEIGAVVAEAAESQRTRVETAGLALAVRSESVVRRVDRDALGQVVVNLIDNAVKYAASGGTLDITVRADGTIAVEDRGPGVPPRHRKRLFDRFYRCDNTLTAHASGSGLGLNIARRLMREMGGDLVYRPREGGGASFVVTLGGKT